MFTVVVLAPEKKNLWHIVGTSNIGINKSMNK